MQNDPAPDNESDPRALLAWGCLTPEIVLRCWEDAAYANRLRAFPKATLAEAGIEIHGQIEVRIMQNSPGVLHLVIPDRPALLSQADPIQLTPDKW